MRFEPFGGTALCLRETPALEECEEFSLDGVTPKRTNEGNPFVALNTGFVREGAIVVDEEHEGSYKNGETPRYHAREVSVVRARDEGLAAGTGLLTVRIRQAAHRPVFQSLSRS